ncbi:CocE/NonD family hydrolase [Streptomyces sp. BH097]|uniref:CocE/NonD family hydrolase n=1 Tax=unclassified Streptomyces TaxID=2593676 RepID=UPI003BB53D0F
MPFMFERVGAAPVSENARQYMVRMRDGVRLATDVYLPGRDDGTVLPAVLVRLPYDKNSRYVHLDRIAHLFTARGYAVVVQDVRGKFRSGGATLPFLREPDDGYDSIDWIVQQPWSDGVVGMFGDSYYGFTQWAAVASEHPALRAIVPRVTAADFSTIWRPDQRPAPVWLEGIEYFAHHWVDRDTYEYVVDHSARPLLDRFDEAFEAIGARSAWFDLMAPRQTERPTQPGPHPFDTAPVPVLHCVGWFDNIGVAHMRDYAELASRPGWNDLQYLWAGAIDHENYRLSHAPVMPENDHALDENALDRMLPGYVAPALDFFDVFLKGVRPAASLAKVTWELGHAGWRTAPAWPPPQTSTRTYWLDEPDRATGALPGGLLTDAPAGRPAEVHWTHDPDAPVPSLVEDSFALLRGHPDFAHVAARADVLAFSGPVLDTPLDLAGPITLHLDVSGTAPTYEVFAKLLDLHPGGQARLVARGQVLVTAATPCARTTIVLGHTGYRLRPGHRLALLVAGSDHPLYLPTTGTGENPWTATVAKPATQGLHTGGDRRASRLTVTVLPHTSS